MLVVLVDQVIELVHFENLILLGDVQFSNLLVVTFNCGINADFLLIEDRFLGAQVIVVAIDCLLLTLTLDKFNLVCDPVFLNIGCLVIGLLYLLLDVVTMVFDWAHEFVSVSTSLQVGTLTVQTIDLQSFLLNS